jgi:hypothetical protein
MTAQPPGSPYQPPYQDPAQPPNPGAQQQPPYAGAPQQPYASPQPQQPPYASAQPQQPPYASAQPQQPTYAEQPPPYAQQQPPYGAGPAPYQTVTPDQRNIWETKGKRGIGFGVAWLAGGLLISIITYANAAGGGVYIVAWGPVIYGIYRIVAGYRMLNKARS